MAQRPTRAGDTSLEWLNLANLSMLTGDFDKAEKVPRQLLEKNPKQWEAHFVLGNLSPRCRSLRTLRRRTGNWRPMVNLATLLLEGTSASQYAEALKLLAQAATIEPFDWRIAHNQALASPGSSRPIARSSWCDAFRSTRPADHPMVDSSFRASKRRADSWRR